MDFWLNVAATTIGVIVGIPAGLWLNERAAQRAATSARRQEEIQIADSLRALEVAIDANRPRLQRVVSEIAAGNSLFDAGLDTAAWTALAGTLTPAFQNPQLRQRLSYHFVRLAGLMKMMDLLVQFATRDPNSAAVIAARQLLANGIKQAATDLDQEGEQLCQELSAARAGLPRG